MKKNVYLLAFVLAFAIGLAVSQNAPTSSTNTASPPPQTNPAGTDQPPSTGMQTGSGNQSATSTGDAQNQIQNAMKNDQRLQHDNIMVSVSGNEVDLTGEVATKEEKDAATKIANRYAGSYRVKNHLQVRSAASGPSSNASPGLTSTSPDNKLGSIAGNASANANGQTPGSTTGGVAGATTVQNTPAVGNSENGLSSGGLQSQIQNALKNEPTLINNNLNVSVSDDQIDLAGTVATAKEKLTAERIAESYAGNRKVKDRVTISGRSHDPQNSASNPDQSKSNSASQPPR